MSQKHRVLAVLLLSGSAALASPDQAAHKPPPDDQVAREVLELRAKLFHAGREQARADLGKYRALCDSDGYPLVGNIANKGSMVQPSEVCMEVRKAGKK